ncbi:nitrogen fixation/metabolism regulation signal transduction histidine kinase [Natronocella acetinitrilica]|uniref:Nitrogen fixation/metabolism regulation signal transduction histidine kinase n=1 Tax=Natronocella acetinitrilica TaxID=414046 RepID=A0AAE3G6B3_9GAMM|nr:twin transmembrane helix small protein [Natronocella acetinitrilica]MCP1675208.1 nitrogen fixation/metabolism regulation signal transduction histidine kinase [Natronocella acetinitrilica]
MTILSKILIVLFLIAIVASLASGAFFLIRDQSDSRRVVRALTVRITLSVLLFLILIALVFSGVIQPNNPYGPR